MIYPQMLNSKKTNSIIKIGIAIKEKADRFYIVNPETTVLKIKELYGGDLRQAVNIVIENLIFAKRFEKRSQKAKEDREKREYFNYLNSIQNEIDLEITEQEKIIRENNPSLDECIARINSEKMTLWERSPRHDDFLDVMIGSGCLPASIELSYQKRSVTEKATDCSERLMKLVELEKILKDVPITISFLKSRIVGLIGDRNNVIKTAKALLLELTALHNYSDLKIIFIFSEKERDIWNFVKWIPHTWDDEKSFRYVANDVDEAKELSNLIANIRSETDNKVEGPHYLIVAADRILTDKIQSIKEFTQTILSTNLLK